MRDLPTPATAEHRLAIATGISRRLIAARFKVSADAAWRHGREHLTAEIRAALATKVLAREGDMHRILLKEGSGVVEALKAIRGPLFDMFLVAIDLRQARVCDAGDRCPVSILLSRSEEYCERQVWAQTSSVDGSRRLGRRGVDEAQLGNERPTSPRFRGDTLVMPVIWLSRVRRIHCQAHQLSRSVTAQPARVPWRGSARTGRICAAPG